MKNNNRYILFPILFLLFLLPSCSDFLDINDDPNNPVDVAEPQILGGIIANFSYEVLGGYPVRVTNTWVQQTAYNVALPHYGMYDINENAVNNTWTFYSYTDVMQNCKILVEKAESNQSLDYAGVARVIWAWNMSMVTDLWNNVPFSQAWDNENFPFPVYDSQESIYEGLQILLDEAIANFDNPTKKAPFIGAEDFVYGGDISKWRKLAHLLKARFHMHLTYAPGKDPATQADLALKDLTEAFESSADNATYLYLSEQGQENPWFQYTIDGKWNTNTQISTQYIALLQNTSDPRIHAHAQLVTGQYIGHPNGAPTGTAASAIGNFYSDADAGLEWFTYTEQKFIEAEALFLKGDRTNAELAYQEGINANFDKLTTAITEGAAGLGDSLSMVILQDIEDYKTANNTLSSVDETAYAQILTQKYIGNFLQFETYNDVRRTGIPQLQVAQNVIQTDLTEIATRWPYPSAELNFNADNVNAQNVSVGRKAVSGKVWWDSAPENCSLCPN